MGGGCAKNFWCPFGGQKGTASQSGTCLYAPSCPNGQARDPLTNECLTKAPQACPAAGNPIQPALANKWQTDVDYTGAGSFPLRFFRTYNSIAVRTGEFAPQWRHNYNRSVWMPRGQSTMVRVYRPDGAVLTFTDSGGVWVTDADTEDSLSQTGTGWEFRAASDDSVEQYDSEGRLLSITSRAGLTQYLSYSATGGAVMPVGFPSCTAPTGASVPEWGKLWCVTDSFGRQLSFGYDAAHDRITRVSDPSGNVITYGYTAASSSGFLGTVTYPDGKVRTYQYNESANNGGVSQRWLLTGITDERGNRFATFKYDGTGRAISSEHAGGAGKVTLSYGVPGSTTTVTDARNTARTYSFQTIHGVPRLTSISQPCPTCGGTDSAALSYDANGNLASRKDFNGNLTCYTNDLARNLETQRVEGLTGAICPGTPGPSTRTISTQWHATWRLPTAIAEPKRITSYTYDTNGNLAAKSVQATTDATGAQGFSATASGTPRTWTYGHTYHGTIPGFITQTVVNGPRTDVTDTTTYAYDSTSGTLASVTNALGHVTTFGNFDAHGRAQRITDPNGLVTDLTYDLRGRLTSRNVGGELTSYEYDGVG